MNRKAELITVTIMVIMIVLPSIIACEILTSEPTEKGVSYGNK